MVQANHGLNFEWSGPFKILTKWGPFCSNTIRKPNAINHSKSKRVWYSSPHCIILSGLLCLFQLQKTIFLQFDTCWRFCYKFNFCDFQERMRMISQLAKNSKKEDNFGMRDEDWEVYKKISKVIIKEN